MPNAGLQVTMPGCPPNALIPRHPGHRLLQNASEFTCPRHRRQPAFRQVCPRHRRRHRRQPAFRQVCRRRRRRNRRPPAFRRVCPRHRRQNRRPQAFPPVCRRRRRRNRRPRQKKFLHDWSRSIRQDWKVPYCKSSMLQLSGACHPFFVIIQLSPFQGSTHFFVTVQFIEKNGSNLIDSCHR